MSKWHQLLLTHLTVIEAKKKGSWSLGEGRSRVTHQAGREWKGKGVGMFQAHHPGVSPGVPENVTRKRPGPSPVCLGLADSVWGLDFM